MGNLVGNSLKGISHLGFAGSTALDVYGSWMAGADDVGAMAIGLGSTLVGIAGDMINGDFHRAAHTAISGTIRSCIMGIPLLEYANLGGMFMGGQTIDSMIGNKCATWMCGEPKQKEPDNSASAKFANGCAALSGIVGLASFSKMFKGKGRAKAGDTAAAPSIPAATPVASEGLSVSRFEPLKRRVQQVTDYTSKNFGVDKGSRGPKGTLEGLSKLGSGAKAVATDCKSIRVVRVPQTHAVATSSGRTVS